MSSSIQNIIFLFFFFLAYAGMAQEKPKSIQKEIDLPISAEEAWNKWTTKEGLQSFFVEDCNVNIELGGKYELFFDMSLPEGERGTENCKVLSYISKKMLVFFWKFSPDYQKIRHKKTRIVLLFKELTPDTSHFTLIHEGWETGFEWEQAHSYYQVVWDQVLEKFQRSISIETHK